MILILNKRISHFVNYEVKQDFGDFVFRKSRFVESRDNQKKHENRFLKRSAESVVIFCGPISNENSIVRKTLDVVHCQ